MELAEAYGLPPALVQQAQQAQKFAVLGNVGSTLLAASQAGPVGQRGQILSRMDIGGAANTMNAQLLNSAQMRLYAENLKDRKQQREAREKLRKAIGGMDKLTPEMKALALTDPQKALELVTGEQAAERRRRAELRATSDEKVAQLVESGVPEPLARGIASGRYIVQKDPVDQTSKVIDISTGMPVGQQPGAAAPSPQQQPSPMPTTAVSGQQPLDYSLATGGTGVVGNALNTVGGLVGAQPFPNVERAKTALDSLRMRTITEMSAAIPGRDTNQIRTYMEKRTVDPASVAMGDSRALDRLGQVRRDIASEINRVQNLITSGGIRPTEISNVRSNLTNLQALLRDYDVVLGNFGSQQQQQPQPQPQGASQGASQGQGNRIRIDVNGNIIQ